MSKDKELVLSSSEAKGGLVVASGADSLLNRIRPEWQARGLINRTRRLLPIDPSSACQRLLNATIYDLRHKIVVAGVDLAKEAAARFKLPSISLTEDITENYSTARIIDLSYRMGILSRTEWRKIKRCYEIRGDLEHEDDEYEADIDDIIYIFKNCVEFVLSKDPVEIIRVADIKELVDAPKAAVLTSEILEEYEHAPNSRQREIGEHLFNTALDSKKPDIVRQNSVELLRQFKSITKTQVLVDIGELIHERYKRKRLELVVAKVAYAAGVFPYLKQKKVLDFFEWMYERFQKSGYHWKQFDSHGEPLDDFEDVGGFMHCPKQPREKLVLWMTLCYLGEPGGYGDWGRSRKVFNSDVAAPRIKGLFKKHGSIIVADLEKAKKRKLVKAAVNFKPIARRLETLEDLVSDE
ncbi:MAG: hypothetical protein KKI12_13080 [Proteobacteria bacterium]|nr:hypothetical protein [Pseudomonadota bacterium]MBU4258987.1 hypothetical protein [Pseudomonadota bacterium]MBU4289090.1 hypothetical protein [Pseudomonadota bacterium]MBU4415162.1 hypothetical protein [Pseudomonadota bacterium]MCG2757267.1 hypothetical protein [Desulfobacteraceae bacterium]